MKKLVFVIGGILLVLALILNIKISFNQSELSDASLLSMQNVAMALPESTNDGAIAKNSDCYEDVKVYNNPFDRTEFIIVRQNGHSTNCLIGWPNWGCDEHNCKLNTWAN